MSNAITFDTLAFAKKLESSGMDNKHAEGVAEAMRDVFEENLSNVVFTKSDGKILKSELKTEIIMWVIGLLLAQTAIIISFIVALVKFIH